MKAAKSLWMLAAILICGAATFTSCTNEDGTTFTATFEMTKVQ